MTNKEKEKLRKRANISSQHKGPKDEAIKRIFNINRDRKLSSDEIKEYERRSKK